MELDEITEEIENKTCTDSKKLIWGHGKDETLGNKVRVTVIATGLRNRADKQVPFTEDLYENEKNGQTKIPYDSEPEAATKPEPETPKEEKVQIPLGGDMPDNNQLRKKSEVDTDAYLSKPAYYREQELKKSSLSNNDELSRYRATDNGLQCSTPSFLEDVVD